MKIIKEKQKLLEKASKSFRENLESTINDFEKESTKFILEINTNFRKNRRNLIELIIKNIGFDFF